MSSPTSLDVIRPLNLLIRDPEQFQYLFRRWSMKKRSFGLLHKDCSALLRFPQYVSSINPFGQRPPTITVTTTEGETLFLHENGEFRAMVSRSWRRTGKRGMRI